MKNLLTLLAVSLVSYTSNAQAPYIPPDLYGDDQKISYGIWEQRGQVVGPDQAPQRDIQYYTEGAYPRAYFREKARISLVLAVEDTIIDTPDTLHRLDLSFTGAQAQNPDAISYLQKDYIQNFYMPWCGPSGVTNVHGFSRVIYQDIYPFIDMHVYSGRVAQKIAFVVRPGGNPENLRLKVQGQDELDLDFWGNLKILLSDKWIYLRQAVAYQVNLDNSMIPVNWTASYLPDDSAGVVGFHTESYDNTKPLVLLIGALPMGAATFAPGMCYSTYFGGDAWDQIAVNTIDGDGNHYVTGTTYSTFLSFPGTPGTNYFSGSPTLFACRMNDQDHVEWKNYFGGSGNAQRPNGIAVRNGPDPKVYVAGWTATTNFYCEDASPGNDYFDNSGSGANNGFIVRFDHNEGVLEHSTYFGNNWMEITDITIDPQGRLIAVGVGIDGMNLPVHQVPLPPGAEQWGYGGGWDGFIAMFNLNDKLLWSTPFGGTGDELAEAVCSRGNKIVVAGFSSSSNFPQAMNGGGNQNVGAGAGSNDIMILEFNLNGDQQWGTLFGGNGADRVGPHGLDIDPVTGDIYIVGHTKSTNLPLLHPTDWYDSTTPSGTNFSGYIAEFSSSRNRRWITYVNGDADVFLRSVRVGLNREVFVGGFTAGANFPCNWWGWQLYYRDAMFGTKDGVIMRFDQVHNYLWGTYFGGDLVDEINSLALKEGQRLYACGLTNSPFGPNQYFPLFDEQIPGSWYDEVFGPSQDGFISAFCIGAEPGVGVPTLAADDDTALAAWLTASGEWSVAGAATGAQILTIADAAGRLVFSSTVRVFPDGSLRIDPGVLSPGIYVLRVGARSTKVFVQQR
jgi:hypothetical protein